MRAFYNRRDDIVSEAIDGLVAASGGQLSRFSPASHARVVLRSDWDKSKVAIVSGGGSGHEPSHAGLVGEGLLTAAVCGEIFASPSVDAVLSAILAVTGPAGCLLVVKNYTGDRLNFGLAAEKANALGLKVEMVIVSDDIALPDAPRPRGIAGTVFVHKIAGSLSEDGGSLSEIVEAVERALPGIMSIGAARDTCTVPDSPKQQRIGPDEVEIGLGIHGEPGIELTSVATANELVTRMVARLRARMEPGRKYAALLNTLGGLAGLEAAVIMKEVMTSEIAGNLGLIAGPAPVMTALDMPGFSISLLALTAELEDIVLRPVQPAAFPVFVPVARPGVVEAPELPATDRYAPSRDAIVSAIALIIIDTCLDMEAAINELDAKVGDGDTGSTFAGAARAVRQRLEQLPFANGVDLMANLSDILRQTMGGSSGVLLAIMFAKASEDYRHGRGWVGALLAGVDAMQKYGGARPGDRTMIDAMRPGLEALASGASLVLAAQRAREGADRTAGMLKANAGRSAYLDARSLQGINDPGAEAMARLFEALADRYVP